MKFTLHDNIEDYDPETQTEMEFISAEGYSGPLTHTNFAAAAKTIAFVENDAFDVS